MVDPKEDKWVDGGIKLTTYIHLEHMDNLST